MHVAWIAEVWNSLSSSLYVYLASFGVHAYFVVPVDRWGVGIGYVVLLITGYGSIFFHGTLLRNWQLFE